jgi:hypothetical protein
MRDLCRLIGWTVVGLLRSRATLEAEIWTLRQQINGLWRVAAKKLSISTIDRLIFVGLYRLFLGIGDRQAGYHCPLASRGSNDLALLSLFRS